MGVGLIPLAFFATLHRGSYEAWKKSYPDAIGDYEFKCLETNNKIEILEVFERDGDLWINCRDVGEYPVKTYSDGLTNSMWRKK